MLEALYERDQLLRERPFYDLFVGEIRECFDYSNKTDRKPNWERLEIWYNKQGGRK